MTTLLDYAQLSSRVYNRTQVNRTPVPEGWTEITWLTDDPVSGFSAGAYRNGDGSEIVISFTGSNEKLVADFGLANIPAGVGLSSAQITQAAAFALDIMAANPGAKITFTGHSLGGGLASVMAVFFDKAATIFDPAPFQLTAVNPVVFGYLQAYLALNDYNNSAFNDYTSSLGTLFSEREAKVTSYYLSGEILEPLRAAVPVIAGMETHIPVGAQSILDTAWPNKLFAAKVTLHSMTLLNDMLLSPQFALAVQGQSQAVEVFTDETLYASDPQKSSKPDFLNRMLIEQVGDPVNGAAANGILDALGADMMRVHQPGEIDKGILATLAEYYYYQRGATPLPFIEAIGAGISLDLSRIAGESNGEGQQRLRQQLHGWLDASGERWVALEGINRVTLQQDAGALNVDMQGDGKSDLVTGGYGDDQIHGGDGNDVLIGLAGADTLLGDGGDDELRGGAGDDALNGGDGYDAYFIAGHDTIQDSDGMGRIRDSAGHFISGFIQEHLNGSYTFLSDPAIGVTRDTNLTLILADGTSVVVENFQDGNLGLYVSVEAPPPPVAVTGTSDDNFLSIADGGAGTVFGNAGRDMIWGSSFADELDGGDGGDWIVGNGAVDPDHVIGGAGDDLISGIAGGSRVEAGDGNDIVFGDRFEYMDINGPASQISADVFWADLIQYWHPAADASFSLDATGYLTGIAGGGVPSDFNASGPSMLGNGWTYQFSIDGSGIFNATYYHPTDAPGGISPAEYWRHGIVPMGPQQAGVTVDGGAGNDFLAGFAQADYLAGGADNDMLFGNNGDDVLDGGTGADNLAGGDGSDALLGADGGDTLFGESGSDYLSGDMGDDTLWGDSASLSLAEQDGNDYLDGGVGNDMLVGQGGADTLIGGAGNDSLYGEASDTPAAVQGDDYLDGGTGDDILIGGGGDDTIYGGDDNDTLDGDINGLADALYGNDYLEGGAGDDTLIGNGGADTLLGGDGLDRLYGEAADTPDGVQGDDSLDGGAGDDILAGCGGADTLAGGGGDDTLDGDAGGLADALYGNDYLDGGAGNDTLIGNGGSDTLLGGDGDDALNGDGDGLVETLYGNDYLDGGAGNDTLVGSGGSDTLAGGDGNDILDGDGGGAALALQGGDYLDGGAGDDLLFGDNGADTLLGGGGADYLNGGADDDSLDGGEGDDTLVGGAGNDTLSGGDGIDWYVLDAGFGEDRIVDANTSANGVQFNFSFAGAGLILGLGSLKISFANQPGAVLHIDGFDPNDPLNTCSISTFSFTDQTLSLQDLLDIGMDLTGTPYEDFISGTALNERLNALESDDVVHAGGGNDVVNGGDGNDSLYGENGDDMLSGGAGDDLLDGGGGADILTGGSGDDTYVVDSASDTIIENDGEGTDTVMSGVSYSLDNAALENLMLGGGDDLFAMGNAGDNLITGNSGDNVLNGGSGADTMTGGAGNDTYYVDNAADLAVEIADAGIDKVYSTASYTLGDNIEDLTLTGIFDQDGTGNALDNVILGNDAINTLDGGDGNDTLTGQAGDDTLNGGTGGDAMDGGYGGDTYVVDNSGDRVIEEFVGIEHATYPGTGGVIYYIIPDIDTVNASLSYILPVNIEYLTLTGGDNSDGTGNALDNIITGNDGANVLSGNDGADRLFGAAGGDTLYGGGGADTLDGGSGADTLAGGADGDTYYVDDGADLVVENAGDGSDMVFSAVSYTLSDNVERLTLTGGGDIVGTGNVLNNIITGNNGINILTGGLGSDLYFVQNSGDTVVEDAEVGTWDTIMSSADFILGDNVEELDLTDDAVSGTGNYQDNFIHGSETNNILRGEGGNDALDGRAGNDTLYGGDGDDTLLGGDNIFTPDSNEQIPNMDTLDGGAGDDYIDGGTGDGIIHGGAGDDILLGGVDVGELGFLFTNNDTIDGGDGNDQIDGGSSSDKLYGGAGDDWIYGGGESLQTLIYDYVLKREVAISENDILDGGAGNDTLSGGDGADGYAVDGGYTKVSGSYSTANDCGDIVTLSGEHLEWTTDTVIEYFGAGYDTVRSSASYVLPDEVERLELIHDPVLAQSDPQQEADLQAFGQDGFGNALDNVIIGNDLVNRLEGGDGADLLEGGSGNDKLLGGAGDDVLRGGGGDDRYVFRLGDGADRIEDNQGDDTLYIGSDMTAAAVQATALNGDLVIGIAGSADAITVANWFGQAEGISRVEFCDGAFMNKSDILSLVPSPPPLVTRPLAGQITQEDEYFSYQAPADAFSGSDLSYTAGLADGSVLPSWLAFDAATQTFSGTPDNWDIGSLDMVMTAADSLGHTTGSPFSLEVLNVNDAPTVVRSVPDQVATEGEPFILALASGQSGDFLDDPADTGTPASAVADFDNWLWGSGGNDTYGFAPGDGHVYLGESDNSPLDSVRFAPGIAPSDITVGLGGWGDPVLEVTGTGDSLTLGGWLGLYDPHGVEQMLFDDGTIWNASDLMSMISTSSSSGSDFLTGTAGGDTLVGGAGNDSLAGGGGSDLLSGGSGGDSLYADRNYTDAGNDLLMGGAGNDYIDSSLGNDLLLGGTGDEEMYGGDGNDVVLFNRGDGNDRYGSDWSSSDAPLAQRTDSVSLGGGIGYADLSFERDVSDGLILHTGNGESIAFAGWFDTSLQDNKAIKTLQVVAAAMPGYDADSADPLLNKRIQQFDFAGLAAQFEAAFADDPTITTWALAPFLAEYSLGGMDSAAMGGDMAYLYGKEGNLNLMSETEVRAQLNDPSFGRYNQVLSKLGGLAELFDDADFIHGDGLTYSVTLEDGAALPAWLSFADETGIFSGTPGHEDIGALNVKITAADSGGLSASSIFALGVAGIAPIDFPPTAHDDSVAVDEDTARAVIMSESLLANDSDPDTGDTLSIIGFDAVSDQGNMVSRDADGNLLFDIGDRYQSLAAGQDAADGFGYTVSDTNGATVSATVNVAILGANDGPIAMHTLDDLYASEDQAFQFTVPAEVFFDLDQGDRLTYQSMLANGDSLPSWLSFDAATRAFDGTPSNKDVGDFEMVVTATDTGNLSASNRFVISVLNVNDAPVVTNPLTDLSVKEGRSFGFKVPVTAFDDVDIIHGDRLSYSATLANGSALPRWLDFDSSSLAFSGCARESGNWSIKVRTTDLSGASADSTFTLHVADASDSHTLWRSRNNKALYNGNHSDEMHDRSRDEDLACGAYNDIFVGRKHEDYGYGNNGIDIYRTEWKNRYDYIHHLSNENKYTGDKISSGKAMAADQPILSRCDKDPPIALTDDSVLLGSQVQQLVNAMAQFAPLDSGQLTMDKELHAQLDPIIAANWHSAA